MQKDRVDKCAAGWDEKSELSKHQSQKGTKLHFFFFKDLSAEKLEYFFNVVAQFSYLCIQF